MLKAQTIDRALLDNYFDSLAHYDQAMGVLSIYRGDNEIYSRAIGYADPAMTIKSDPSMVYRVGSITKSFTAVIAHRLAIAGEISLQDKLDKYYPTVPNAGEITLDQMLRHQSGIANYTNDESIMDWISTKQSPAELLGRIVAMEPDFAPGEDVSYSNSNYLLLGYIAERVTGKSYAELLTEYVTTPAALRSTYYGGPIDATKNEVVSFQAAADGWAPVPEWDMGNAAAAGAIVSTASDLNRFYRQLLRGDLLPMEAVEEMKKERGGLGQGLFSVPFGEELGYGHNGGIEGFITQAAHFVDSDITIAYLGNGVRLPINDILIAGLSVANGLPFEVPDLAPVADLPESEVAGLVGTYGSESFPLDITIFFEEGKLYARATGQGAFPLTPGAANEFVFTPAGIVLLFEPEQNTVLLKQGGGEFLLKKQP